MDNFLLEIPNALPAELCENLIKKFDANPEQQVTGALQDKTGNYVNEDLKASTELNIRTTPDWEVANDKVSYHILESIKKYLDHVKGILEDAKVDEDGDLEFVMKHSLFPITIGNPCIQCIEKGNHYRWHQDYLNSEPRLMTTFVYLNTLEPDEGGTTDFINGRSIRPEVGKMTIFPCTWPFIHTGRVVKADKKYILVTNIYRG